MSAFRAACRVAALALTAFTLCTAATVGHAESPHTAAHQGDAFAALPQAQPQHVQPQQEAAPAGDGAPAAQSRALSPHPARTVLVKAQGKGGSPKEAREAALRRARALAAEHLERVGGALALVPGEDGQRIVSLRNFPDMGMAPSRVAVLVEFHLRPLAEPIAADAPVLSLHAELRPGVLTLKATRACEAVAFAPPEHGGEPQLFPGGVRVLRLAPDKPLEQTLPQRITGSLRVLACTGGLSVPPAPDSIPELLDKARLGRPHPAMPEGVLSDCVEVRARQ